MFNAIIAVLTFIAQHGTVAALSVLVCALLWLLYVQSKKFTDGDWIKVTAVDKMLAEKNKELERAVQSYKDGAAEKAFVFGEIVKQKDAVILDAKEAYRLSEASRSRLEKNNTLLGEELGKLSVHLLKSLPLVEQEAHQEAIRKAMEDEEGA